MSTLSALATADYDPFKGIRPSFGPFASLLESKIGVFMALIWALASAWVAYQLVVSIASLARSRRVGMAGDMSEAKDSVLVNVGVIVALMAVPAIWAVATSV